MIAGFADGREGERISPAGPVWCDVWSASDLVAVGQQTKIADREQEAARLENARRPARQDGELE
jgi:hypothetical protein